MSYVATIPQNGFEKQSGGQGVRILFEQLFEELQKKGVVHVGEVLSQVNVDEEGLVFYFSKKEEG